LIWLSRREVDLGRRLVDQHARLGDVEVQLLLMPLGEAVHRHDDGRLVVARERAQRRLLQGPGLGPVLERQQAGIRIRDLVLAAVGEDHGLRRQLGHRDVVERADLADLELLRSRRLGGQRREGHQQGENMPVAHGFAVFRVDQL